MISSPLLYLFSLTLIVVTFVFLEKTFPKIFKYLPVIVLVYLLSMFLASQNIWQNNTQIHYIYSTTKTNLLPAMLFLMLLQFQIIKFFRVRKVLLVSYILLLGFLFFTAFILKKVLIIDASSLVIFLLLLKSTTALLKSFGSQSALLELGCACSIDAKRYYPLILLSILVSITTQLIAVQFSFVSYTFSVLFFAGTLGVVASFTLLSRLNGSSEIANTMLYFLVALLGSQTHLQI